jgi:hypothetical protein
MKIHLVFSKITSRPNFLLVPIKLPRFSYNKGRVCGTVWEDRNAYRVMARKPEVKDHTDDLGVDARTTLNQILKK